MEHITLFDQIKRESYTSAIFFNNLVYLFSSIDLKAQHYTTTQFVNAIDAIANNLNKRYKTEATLLDIEKIFNKI